jgi:hypothetical protein
MPAASRGQKNGPANRAKREVFRMTSISSGARTGNQIKPPGENQSVLVGEFSANSREVARVTLDEYKGHKLVRVSKWWPDELGELRPGKGGIAVNVKHLPRLAELIAAALDQARTLGLIEEGGGGEERP